MYALFTRVVLGNNNCARMVTRALLTGFVSSQLMRSQMLTTLSTYGVSSVEQIHADMYVLFMNP